MEPQFEGVFVNGIPLEEHMIEEERDDKSHEIENLRNQAEKKYKFNVVRFSTEKITDTKKVSKRVIRWRDREIRKEYGIMAKPFESNAQNTIWAIIEKGPVSTKEIGQEIEWAGNMSTLSAMVATVWARLGNKHEGAAGVLERDKHGMTYLYYKKKGVDLSVEAAIEKYNLIGSAVYRKKLAAKKAAKTSNAVTTPKTTSQPNTDRPALEWEEPVKSKVEADVEAVVSDVVRKQPFGINVNVRGIVEVVFRWGGPS